MLPSRVYFPNLSKTTRYFNVWDIFALVVVLGALILLTTTAKQMAAPYQLGERISISLDPSFLPHYAMRTVIRMAIALFFSLTFTFIFGTWAAKSVRAARILVPIIDVMQSVPVLSFLSITLVGFIFLFPNSLLGPECASIFAIFTAQAWNIVLGFYQSLRMVPEDLKEAAQMFHLSPWQFFWRVEVPFSMPSLLWNTMMSLSASWFFVVASEAISVANQDILLPGIGSYIAVAIQKADLHAVGYAIITMFIVILIYDQLIFRPLLSWSEQFHFDQREEGTGSWVLNILKRTRFMRYLSHWIGIGAGYIFNASWFKTTSSEEAAMNDVRRYLNYLWLILFCAFLFISVLELAAFIRKEVSWYEILHVFGLGCLTALRVIILILLASLLWIPIGVWVGLRPKATQIVQPLAQFFAAFPANLVFPIVVLLIIRFNLNIEVWLTPLMILGSQWYILFNVIAGASSIPKDLYQVAENFGLKGWLWWKRLVLPSIFPYFITGAITAAGGAWNASIVAEVVSWGNTKLEATGLGAYITRYTTLGDFPRIALGTSVMCLFVLLFNRFVWRPLYQYAEERFQLPTV